MNDNNFHIFQNIVTNENKITELLCNFLYFKNFRNCFLEAFIPKRINNKLINPSHIKTQIRIENFQPDLIISNETIELFFEIKVGNAQLQATQTRDYHEYLAELKKETFLCFIIPDDYHEIHRIKEIVSEEKENVGIIYWPQIITLIEEQDLNNSSQLFNEFYKLLRSWFEYKKINLTFNEVKVMFSKETPKILLKLFDVIEQVSNKISVNNNDIIISKTKTSYEHGLYVKDKDGIQLFFFGVWYELWEEKGKPLCIANSRGQSTKDYAEIFVNYFTNNIEYKDWNCELISEDFFESELVKKISDKLNELIKRQLGIEKAKNL